MAKRPTLTTTARAPVTEPTTNDAGIPVSSDEFSLTVGPDGPHVAAGSLSSSSRWRTSTGSGFPSVSRMPREAARSGISR